MGLANKVDDNGESSWIFESRDVRVHLFRSYFLPAERSPLSLHGLPIQWTLGECFAKHPRLYQGTKTTSRLFWTALYIFPALWLGLFFVSLLKFNLSSVDHITPCIVHDPSDLSYNPYRFIPIVMLALVFNVTNVVGFTYACVFLHIL
jgi:Eukaryotic protein of unknown function (DUF846)